MSKPDAWDVEAYHYLADHVEEFEVMCFTTVVICGPPAPRPKGMSSWATLGPDAPTTRHNWLCSVEEHVRDRYGMVSPEIRAKFIGAFECWWRMQREFAGDDMESNEVEEVPFVRITTNWHYN